MTPRLAALLLAAAALSVPSRGASGLGREPAHEPAAPTDAVFDPVLRGIELKMPEYLAIEESGVRVPAETIELGQSSEQYRCWRLRLTGGHGKQARSLLERLSSLQTHLKDLRANLLRDMARYEGAPKPNPDLESRVASQKAALDELAARFNDLVKLGTRTGFLVESENALLGGKRRLSPVIRKEDYTMVHDASAPGCPPKEPGGNPGG
ncbi:MAG: hypothetical protein WC728_04910 [Elusimicrobiota bacterium]